MDEMPNAGEIIERLARENRKRYLMVDASQDIQSVASDALAAVLGRLLPERRHG